MARNQQLNQTMKDRRREKILSSALNLFATRGLAAVTIKDLACRSGMSLGLVYHYYRSKEEIFIELVRYALERMNEACRYLESLALSPAAKVRMAVEGLLKNMDEHEDTAMYYLLLAQAAALESIPQEARDIIERESAVPHEVMTRIFREGQEEGVFKSFDAAQMAVVFWTSLKGLAISKAINRERYGTPDAAIYLGMFIREDYRDTILTK